MTHLEQWNGKRGMEAGARYGMKEESELESEYE